MKPKPQSPTWRSLMNDRELNLELAKVCGIPVVGYAELKGHYPHINVVREQVLLWEGARKDAVGWDPVHDWQQVFKYILPALTELGFYWALSAKAVWGQLDVEIRESYLGGICTGCSCETQAALCKGVCAAALDAWTQLKEKL